MLGDIWSASYSFSVPTDLVLAVMCILIAALFFWRFVRWKDKNKNLPLTATPWSVWYPIAFFIISAGVFGYYA